LLVAYRNNGLRSSRLLRVISLRPILITDSAAPPSIHLSVPFGATVGYRKRHFAVRNYRRSQGVDTRFDTPLSRQSSKCRCGVDVFRREQYSNGTSTKSRRCCSSHMHDCEYRTPSDWLHYARQRSWIIRGFWKNPVFFPVGGVWLSLSLSLSLSLTIRKSNASIYRSADA